MQTIEHSLNLGTAWTPRTSAETPTIDIGISEPDRQEIAQGLSTLLADTYVLYVKAQNYHWNVTGPLFPVLHAAFETVYRELADANDLLAERIRALGYPAPASCSEFSRLASIEEETGHPNAAQMIRSLVDGQQALAHGAMTVVPVAERAHDQATLDLLAKRLEVQQKSAWMLRSMLE